MGQDGNIVQFKIKKHTALKKLMSTYCERAGLALQVSPLIQQVFLLSIKVNILNLQIFTRPSGFHLMGPESMRATHQKASTWRFFKLNSCKEVFKVTYSKQTFRMGTPLRSSSSSLVEAGVAGKVISCSFSCIIF